MLSEPELLPLRRPSVGAISNRLYSDRICAPAETVAALRPYFARLGITRVARQTGLDNIGIPCFAAIRPNAHTLATSQGKGIDDDAALASAVMEAAEYAIAEMPLCPVHYASTEMLLSQNIHLHSPERLLPPGEVIAPERIIGWVEAHELFSGSAILVPQDAVTIGSCHADSAGMSRSTNGLASGNCADEAIFHGLCELIERDASTLWGLRGPATAERTALDPAAFDDPVIDALVSKIERAGLVLRLFNQTSDISVPVIYATIFEPSGARSHFDLAAGAGCHPVAARAALRAITEAAQTRITNIAGARDDFDPSEYHLTLPASSMPYQKCADTPNASPPSGCRSDAQLNELTSFCLQALRDRSIDEVIVAHLGGEQFGISVVKVLAPLLEDRGPNINWRPGPRATAALMRIQ